MRDMFGLLATAHQIERLGAECRQVAEPPPHDGIRHRSVGLNAPHTHAAMLSPPHHHHIVARRYALDFISDLVREPLL